jgi:RNA ligase (TIGR02306 family)
MRQLVTITKIKEVKPIPGADAIEAVTMTTNGWTCVVKKGEFNPGDYAVYFEIDSHIPRHKDGIVDERFSFLAGRCDRTFNGIEGYRLRTVKLRGQISQGLVLPIAMFPEIEMEDGKEGGDATNLLRVTLFETAQTSNLSNSSAERQGTFPSFIRKTNQERIQSFKPRALQELQQYEYEVTIKMDGTSCAMYYNKGKFGVCSHNTERFPPIPKRGWLKDFANWFFGLKSEKTRRTDLSVYWNMATKYDVEYVLSDYCKRHNRNLAIHGEICGDGIQSNREKIPTLGQRFFVFDIFDIDTQEYLDHAERIAITADLGLEHVPFLETNYQLPQTVETIVDELVAKASGAGLYNDNREGLVFKARVRTDVSFKVISNDYLLKHGE